MRRSRPTCRRSRAASCNSTRRRRRRRETFGWPLSGSRGEGQGNVANGKEVTNNKFMLEMTKATVLDPTSKERHLHPSKNMTVTSRPDWKFGLGMGVDPDVVDHYAEKYPQVTATATEKAEKAAERARRVAVGPGAHKSKAQLPEPDAPSVKLMASEAAARDEAVDELLEAETEGLWEADVEGVPGAAGGRRWWRTRGVRELSKSRSATCPKRCRGRRPTRSSSRWPWQDVGGPCLPVQAPGAAVCRLRGGEHIRAAFHVDQRIVHIQRLPDPSRSPTPSPPFSRSPACRRAHVGWRLRTTHHHFHAEGEPTLRGPFALSVSHPHKPRLSPAPLACIIDPTPFTFLTPLMHACCPQLAPRARCLPYLPHPRSVPKVNEDSTSEVTLHTATGPMTIPLRATTRKAKIALASPTIDFARRYG